MKSYIFALSAFLFALSAGYSGSLSAIESRTAQVNHSDQIYIETAAKLDDASHTYTLGLSQGVDLVIRPAMTVTKAQPSGVYDAVVPQNLAGKEAVIRILPIVKWTDGQKGSLYHALTISVSSGAPFEILKAEASRHGSPTTFVQFTRKDKQFYVITSDAKAWAVVDPSLQADENGLAKGKGVQWEQGILTSWKRGDIILQRVGKKASVLDFINVSKIARDQLAVTPFMVANAAEVITVSKNVANK